MGKSTDSTNQPTTVQGNQKKTGKKNKKQINPFTTGKKLNGHLSCTCMIDGRLVVSFKDMTDRSVFFYGVERFQDKKIV